MNNEQIINLRNQIMDCLTYDEEMAEGGFDEVVGRRIDELLKKIDLCPTTVADLFSLYFKPDKKYHVSKMIILEYLMQKSLNRNMGQEIINLNSELNSRGYDELDNIHHNLSNGSDLVIFKPMCPELYHYVDFKNFKRLDYDEFLANTKYFQISFQPFYRNIKVTQRQFKRDVYRASYIANADYDCGDSDSDILNTWNYDSLELFNSHFADNLLNRLM
jgi:hypothetical protein